MSEPILVLGKGGQLSSALEELLGSSAVMVPKEEANFLDEGFISQLKQATEDKKFSAVINAAAYTQVDKAEEEPELAMRLNGEALGELAIWCKQNNLPLVHVSTDYVFDGSGAIPFTEDDTTRPLGVYGKTKLAGEKAVIKVGGEHLIFRTSWLYDAYGHNFFNTMMRLFKEKQEISVVQDQVGAPTYVPHLAQAIVDALDAAQKQAVFPSGVYHLCHAGEASWYDFAQAILTLATDFDSAIICNHIKPILSSEYKTRATRPLNSRLDCSKALDTLGVALPHWQEGLTACMRQSYAGDRLQHSGA